MNYAVEIGSGDMIYICVYIYIYTILSFTKIGSGIQN
jgi:hypothetical protein